MSTEKYVVFSDVHFPYEDKQRYRIALKIIQEHKLDHIYLNGDIGEFSGVSAWPKNPADYIPFNKEIEYINERFDELQALFPDVPVTLIEGNHCNRLFRYIRDIAPQMWGLIDCPTLFRFPARPRWKFVVYSPMQLVRCGKSNLYIRHEPLGRGANHAKQTAESSYVDILSGHMHTKQSYSHRKFGPNPMLTTAYSGGWLGDKSKSVFDYRGSKDSWVEGFSQIECDTKSGDYTYDFVDLRKIPVFYRGKNFSVK